MRDREDRQVMIITDSRGHISCGAMHEKGYPMSLNYFNVSAFHELEEFYGKEPSELIIRFPSDSLSAIFNDDYHLWGSNKQLKRRCDGKTCVHFIGESISGKFTKSNKQIDYGEGEESVCVCKLLKATILNEKGVVIKNPYLCGIDMYIKAWVCNPTTQDPIGPYPYLFRSHSRRNSDFIFSELEKFRFLYGIPFKITVKEGKGVGNRRFPIWTLQALIDPKQLITVQYNLIQKYEDKLKELGLQLESPEDPRDENYNTSESDEETDNTGNKKEKAKFEFIQALRKAGTIKELKEVWSDAQSLIKTLDNDEIESYENLKNVLKKKLLGTTEANASDDLLY